MKIEELAEKTRARHDELDGALKSKKLPLMGRGTEEEGLYMAGFRAGLRWVLHVAEEDKDERD